MKAHPLRIVGLATERIVSADDLRALVDASTSGEISVAELLDMTGVDPAARRVHVTSDDSTYSASIPLDDIRRDGVITAEAEGNRLRVHDGTTLCWNVKQVAELRLTVTKEPDSVPQQPTH